MPANTTLTIKDGTTVIAGSACSGFSNLVGVIIPDTVTKVGDFAFSYCYNITNVDMSENIYEVGRSAFCDCKLLNSAGGVDRYIDNVFMGIDTVGAWKAAMTFHNYTRVIVESAFRSEDIPSITIPSGMVNICDYAFSNCDLLKTIILDSEIITSRATEKLSNGNLMEYAEIVYVKDTIPEASIGSYIKTAFNKEETSDKTGYIKYTIK